MSEFDEQQEIARYWRAEDNYRRCRMDGDNIGAEISRRTLMEVWRKLAPRVREEAKTWCTAKPLAEDW